MNVSADFSASKKKYNFGREAANVKYSELETIKPYTFKVERLKAKKGKTVRFSGKFE